MKALTPPTQTHIHTDISHVTSSTHTHTHPYIAKLEREAQWEDEVRNDRNSLNQLTSTYPHTASLESGKVRGRNEIQCTRLESSPIIIYLEERDQEVISRKEEVIGEVWCHRVSWLTG